MSDDLKAANKAVTELAIMVNIIVSELHIMLDSLGQPDTKQNRIYALEAFHEIMNKPNAEEYVNDPKRLPLIRAAISFILTHALKEEMH